MFILGSNKKILTGLKGTLAMNPTLKRCLEDLEKRIDPDEEERLYEAGIDLKGRVYCMATW